MKKKVVVIGLDCATFDFIRPFVNDGHMPNLKKIMDEGVVRTLKSTIPPISPPAWTTFLTGKNPAKHGIFHFFDLDARTYNFTKNRLVNSSFFAGQTFIDFISNRERTVGIVKIPFTYPPWKVNGFMIAGDPSPDWKKAHTFPPELSERIGRVNMGSYFDFERYNTEQLLEHLKYDCNARTRIASTMLDKGQYDFFMLVHNTTDAAAHRFWKYTDPSCPNYRQSFSKHVNIIREVYSDADKSIGQILGMLDKDTTIFFMSDHGALRKPLKFFHLNAWLRGKGYVHCLESKTGTRYLHRFLLKIKYALPPVLRHLVKTIARIFFVKNISKIQNLIANFDWTRTTAYGVSLYTGYDGIVVNLKGRQPHGIIDPGRAADELCAEIEASLLELKDERSQKRIIKKIYRRDEVFSGDFTARMPDLIVQYDENYTNGKSTEPPLVTEVPASDFDFQSGDHDENGIFIAAGAHIKKGVELQPARIQDMAPTILYAMGLPVPDDMDGRVLLDIFKPDFVNANPVDKTNISNGGPGTVTELNEDETAKMKQQLQGLGYL